MTEPQITPDLLAKLPKWAQAHIADLQRQRDAAVEALENIVDHQTPSRIFVEDIVCVRKGAPSFYKTYIQAPRDEVNFILDVPQAVQPFAPRENQVSVRIDRDDPTQVLIAAAWNQISMFPIASNVIALRGVRK